MTDHFEVHARDGPARLGELRLDTPLTTPTAVAPVDDDTPGLPAATRVLEDAGSAWATPPDEPAPTGDPARLTVLPHRAVPTGTDARVAEAFFEPPPAIDAPSAAVVSTHTAGEHGADAYVLSDAPGTVGHAAAFVDAIVTTRAAIPPDTALYLAGVATPANVATLAYAGVDLVDVDRAWVRGLEGFYLTTDGERFLEDLDDDAYPCACPVCTDPTGDGLSREACAEHNVRALIAALARVRRRIREGRLRDYLEGQARHEPWCTATLRRLDDRWSHVEPRVPIARDVELTAATDDALRRVEIRRFADRVTARYRRRLDGPTVLVPCSARKPYGDSQSHGQFHDAIDYRGPKVSMTSPIGVVPAELEYTYPAQHYDSVVTGRWSATETEFVADVLARFLDRAGGNRLIAHVPDDYRPVVERALERADTAPEPIFTVTDHPTTDASLAALDDALSGADRYSKAERERATVRAVADYQFGAVRVPNGADGDEIDHRPGVGDAVFESITIDGRLPSVRVRDADGTQLAALVPQYGTLALTPAGARRLLALDAAGELVAPVARIDDFVPQGSVLAPGVVEARPEIRVGDEVIFEGPAALGVGRALMSGPEMARSTRGIAVQVRHVEAR